MEIITLTDENIADFSAYVDEDMQDEMSRIFYRGIGAIDDSDTPVGVLIYELKDCESEEDTKSRIRVFKCENEDVKRLLMKEYAESIEEEEVARSFYETEDEHMSRDLRENGFSLEVSEALDVVITIEDIKGISKLIRVKKFPPHIMSLSEASVTQYRAFVKNCLFKGRRGLLDDLAYLPMNWFEKDISSCAVTDDKIDGVLLVKKAPSGMLFALLFTAFGPDYKTNLGLLMAYTAQNIIEKYPEDTRVVIRRHNAMVKNLTDKFFAQRKGSDVFSGNRSEA
ncbi:MAG: hypothetical protein K6B14_07865 [Lachnospiraceae bacterium]|nr:hypothetical protein [Lachnospiraceae bacterium]